MTSINELMPFDTDTVHALEDHEIDVVAGGSDGMKTAAAVLGVSLLVGGVPGALVGAGVSFYLLTHKNGEFEIW